MNNRTTRELPPNALPRVLYAVVLEPGRKFGSLEEQIVCLSRSFAANGGHFRPLFICDESANDSEPYQAMGIDVECLDLRTFSWSRLLKLSQLISRHRISVVHWNFTEMLRNRYLWWLTVLHPGVRHYYTDHASRTMVTGKPCGWLKKATKRLLLRRYSKVFCVSQFILDDLVRKGTCSNLALCRHFVNTERFRPDPAIRATFRTEHNANGRFVVLTVGQLIKAKGMEVLIRAMAELPDNVILWIVGDGEESDALHKLVSDLHLAPRVSFHGLQQDVAPFMQAADCFVCPSLWGEAAGLVLLEASASGLPVIASRTGGIPEHIQSGVTGFLFSPGDHHELARYTAALTDNPTLCNEMSRRSRAWAVERFSADVMVPEYLNGYRSGKFLAIFRRPQTWQVQ
jgi:glycosyltransferase involved in cell wall biosynthesis